MIVRVVEGGEYDEVKTLKVVSKWEMNNGVDVRFSVVEKGDEMHQSIFRDNNSFHPNYNLIKLWSPPLNSHSLVASLQHAHKLAEC